MNEQEAIRIIESSNVKLRTAINSLQGLSISEISDKLRQKYGYTLEEALDEKKACELAIKALEKQIPKPVIKHEEYPICPCCKKILTWELIEDVDCCLFCGQRLEREK